MGRADLEGRARDWSLAATFPGRSHAAIAAYPGRFEITYRNVGQFIDASRHGESFVRTWYTHQLPSRRQREHADDLAQQGKRLPTAPEYVLDLGTALVLGTGEADRFLRWQRQALGTPVLTGSTVHYEPGPVDRVEHAYGHLVEEETAALVGKAHALGRLDLAAQEAVCQAIFTYSARAVRETFLPRSDLRIFLERLRRQPRTSVGVPVSVGVNPFSERYEFSVLAKSRDPKRRAYAVSVR